MSINERIKYLSENVTKNPQKLAEEIGINKNAIYKIIKGGTNPSFSTIIAILKRYPNVNARWFILGEGYIFDKKEHVKNDLKASELSKTSQKYNADLMGIIKNQFNVKDQQIMELIKRIPERGNR